MSDFHERVAGLHAGLDQMDYYQLLGVDRTANALVVRQAYFDLAREFHPDRFLTSPDAGLREQVARVFSRMAEAYKVLTDPDRRRAYNEGLASAAPDQLRYRTTERPKAGPRDPAEIAKTATGRKYLANAIVAQRQGNLASAMMHLSLAVKVEPQNPDLLQRLADMKSRMTTKR